MLLDLPFGIIIIRVVGPALSVHLPLQPPDRRRLGSQFRAEHLQARFPFAGNQMTLPDVFFYEPMYLVILKEHSKAMPRCPVGRRGP
jgi:hypothetical protein